MGCGYVTVPTFDQATRDLLKKHVPDFQQVDSLVVQEISNFNWLWPLVEAKCFDKSACMTSISNYFTDEIAAICSFTMPIEYFSNRYLHSMDAEEKFTALLSDHGVKLRDDISAGLCAGSKNKEQAIALALICYRLRNNLFHGNKGQFGFADQGKNFLNANIFLKTLLHSS